ncbi:EAL domain-containing protein [uncultured Enterovirga sp.]|uniref:EAL domain-containing protein n=1 Tax=uncultured Enterovirga sp. TaxID=2026352 RepID=UPI0035CBC12C
MKLTRSLGTRLLSATLATAFVTLAGVVGLVVVRANQNLKEQAFEVSQWSEARLSERLHSDAMLAAARLDSLREDVGRRFASLVERADVSTAIFSGNTVAVAELLRPALASADLEGAIAFDADLKAVSADTVDAKILDANGAIRTSLLFEPARNIIAENDRTAPRGFLRSMPLDPELAAALAATEVGEMADIFGQPIFGEFGEVAGVMLGYRTLKAREPVLQSFARLSGRDVLVFQGARLVSSAGAIFGRAELRERAGSELRFLGAEKVARCVPLGSDLRLCVAAPVSELEHLTEKVVGIGEENSRSLLTTLAAAALLAMTLFGLVTLAVSRHITRPLVRITEVVVEVARGNWRTVVPETSRPDEVGSIARAVLVLEQSLEERDRLREDITVQNERLKTNEIELQEQNARFDAALSNMSQGLCMFDAEARLKVFNPQLLTIYGLAADALQVGISAQTQRCLTFGSIAQDGPAPSGAPQGSQIRSLPDGRIIHVTTQLVADGGWVETHEDQTASRLAQARIAHMAMYDSLTDLPNRALFGDRLAQAHASWRTARRPFSILCLDLDDFKGVNDTLGHEAGDHLLKSVAQRLLANVPPGSTIARLGGDEFAILLHDFADGGLALAQNLVGLLKQPVRLQSQTVLSAASIGVAACTDDHEDPDQLLRNADLALYSAKAEGRGRFRIFDPAMETRAQHRKWLERELRDALSLGVINVYYQPIYDIEAKSISGFEALSRWTHAEIGPISPGEFIPVAEEVGLMDRLGEYVLGRACSEAAAWPVPAKVAVNISAVQIRNPNFCDTVEGVLARTGLPSSRLELEVTESVVLGDDPQVLGKLHRLRALGVRFSMDDFGTGYSSLSSLRSFPFDKIKLDQSFVRDVLEREDCATIVRVVADLGRSLRMTTTAEGVEQVQQLTALKAAGFAEAQGYLFSPAVPNEQAVRMLDRPFALLRAA